MLVLLSLPSMCKHALYMHNENYVLDMSTVIYFKRQADWGSEVLFY